MVNNTVFDMFHIFLDQTITWITSQNVSCNSFNLKKLELILKRKNVQDRKKLKVTWNLECLETYLVRASDESIIDQRKYYSLLVYRLFLLTSKHTVTNFMSVRGRLYKWTVLRYLFTGTTALTDTGPKNRLVCVIVFV